MPKLVDPVARRLEVVDAVFRVAISHGLQHASLRHIADEAGLNIGSLRHYFASHGELMLFAMQAMLDRVTGRLQRRIDATPEAARATRTQRRALVAGLLQELLPVDEIRRAEVTVWIEFMTAARTNPALQPLAREATTGTRSLVRQVLARSRDAGTLRPELDLDIETQRLAALLDGLSFDASLHPDLVRPKDCLTALHAHLDELENAR